MRTSSHNVESLGPEFLNRGPLRSRWRSGWGARLLFRIAWFSVALSLGPTPTWAETATPTPTSSPLFRVGTSGDYAPFSSRSSRKPGASLDGFDIAIARAYAQERGRTLRFVTFRWPELLRDFEAGKFDVAMSGITVRPARSAVGRFSVPVAESGAILLVEESSSWQRASEANKKGFRIGVNAGGYLERVAQKHFPTATLVVIPDNQAVIQALAQYTVDAVVTDSLEAPRWLSEVPGFKPLGPFTRDRKAYLVQPNQPGLAADLDRWLMDRERDGSLAKLRKRYFGLRAQAGEPPASPLRALLAAMDERLSIMPLVGAFKRRNAIALEVPAREKTVLDAAVEGIHRAAKERRVGPPSDAAVRAFFQAQMEAAKEVQWLSVKNGDIDAANPVPDLDTTLRPAILRLGERITHFILDLPKKLDAAEVTRRVKSELRTEHLSDKSRTAIAKALVNLSKAEQP